MASLNDIRQIPDSYFHSNLPDTPLPTARYHYLKYLKDSKQLDEATSQLMDQPEFYANYISGEYDGQLVDNDTLLTIALSMDNLDDVIDMSLVSTHLNDKLKNPVFLNVVKDNVKVIRPIVESNVCSDDGECTSPWMDLIRENSKIHSTKYARFPMIENVPDFPIRYLLINAIRDNRLDLVEKYFQYFQYFWVEAFIFCNTEVMFRALVHEMMQLPIYGKVDTSHPISMSKVISLSCVSNGKVNVDYFRFIHNTAINE